MAECIKDVLQNIQEDCNKPNNGGYTGRAVYIQLDMNPTITTEADNPRTVTAITLPTGKKPFTVTNEDITPFTGSNTTSNGDSGRILYTKTVVLRVPQRGSDVSKNIIEPLTKNRKGFLAILEKTNTAGNGSFEVVGLQQGLKANADGITRDEYANGSDYMVTMSTTENFAEAVFFDTDYETTLAAFNELYNKAV